MGQKSTGEDILGSTPIEIIKRHRFVLIELVELSYGFPNDKGGKQEELKLKTKGNTVNLDKRELKFMFRF